MKQNFKSLQLLKFGCLLALFLVLNSLLKHAFLYRYDSNFSLISNIVIAVPAYLFFIIRGIRYAKTNLYPAPAEDRKSLKSGMSKGIKAGVQIGLVAALLVALYTLAEIQLLPDYYTAQLQADLAALAEQNLSAAELETAQTQINALYQPLSMAISNFFTTAMASLLVALFCTPFIYKKLIINSKENQN